MNRLARGPRGGAPTDLDPSTDQARQWLSDELARSEYQDTRSLFQRLMDWLSDRLADLQSTQGTGGASFPPIVITLVVVLLVAEGHLPAHPHPRGEPDGVRTPDALLGDSVLTAEQLRREAERALAEVAFDDAVLAWTRAIARDAESRTLLPHAPSMTAHEVGTALSVAFPVPGRRHRPHHGPLRRGRLRRRSPPTATTRYSPGRPTRLSTTREPVLPPRSARVATAATATVRRLPDPAGLRLRRDGAGLDLAHRGAPVTTELWERSAEAAAESTTEARGAGVSPDGGSPRARGWRRRWVLVASSPPPSLAVAFLFVSQGPGPASSAPLDPRNPTANGAQALARVLEAQGVRVVVARGEAELERAGVDADTTVVVTRTAPLAESTTKTLARLASRAERLVLVAPDRASCATSLPR